MNSVQGPHLEKVAPLSGRLDQEEFLADAFRINSFKVIHSLPETLVLVTLTNAIHEDCGVPGP